MALFRVELERKACYVLQIEAEDEDAARVAACNTPTIDLATTCGLVDCDTEIIGIEEIEA